MGLDCREKLYNQSFILRMDSHSLVEMTYVLHRVYSPIIYGESSLMEMSRKACIFNLACERQFGDLVKGFAHSVVSHTSM